MEPGLFKSLLILAALTSNSFAAPSTWCSSTESGTYSVINSIQLAADAGARCSDGTICETGYDYCCYINGTETCVKSLSECKDE